MTKEKTNPRGSNLPAKSYPLRSQSWRTSRNSLYTTPTKSPKTDQNNQLTPSSSICSICKGVESFRSISITKAIAEFTEKIDSYNDLTKSLNENSSNLSNSINTMRHFILTFQPDSAVNTLTKTSKNVDRILDKVEGVDNRLADISNYITKLDDLEKLVNEKIQSVNVPSSHCKVDTDLTARISNVESLITQLNEKLDSINTIPTTRYSDSRYSNKCHNPSQQASPNPSNRSLLIIGDSNTRYINMDDAANTSARIPTMLIEDINPMNCRGYKKIWLHVGINSMKSIHCRGPDDVVRHFHCFMNKLRTIRLICPDSRIIVSPILPTNIIELNKRAKMFNRMLFSSGNWFTVLDFNQFCGGNDRLMRIYRSYNNPRDNIHLGVLGIQVLVSKVRHALKFTDTRSYSQALRSSPPRRYAT